MDTSNVPFLDLHPWELHGCFNFVIVHQVVNICRGKKLECNMVCQPIFFSEILGQEGGVVIFPPMIKWGPYQFWITRTYSEVKRLNIWLQKWGSKKSSWVSLAVTISWICIHVWFNWQGGVERGGWTAHVFFFFFVPKLSSEQMREIYLSTFLKNIICIDNSHQWVLQPQSEAEYSCVFLTIPAKRMSAWFLYPGHKLRHLKFLCQKKNWWKDSTTSKF